MATAKGLSLTYGVPQVSNNSLVVSCLGCIHYVLPGGGEEDFINQYSIFSYPSAQFPKNFVSLREDGSDFVIPPLLEFESFLYWHDMQ